MDIYYWVGFFYLDVPMNLLGIKKNVYQKFASVLLCSYIIRIQEMLLSIQETKEHRSNRNWQLHKPFAMVANYTSPQGEKMQIITEDNRG